MVDRGPGHPDKWDPRVAPLAKIVEAERGLTFDHPVYVDFMPVADFKTKVLAENAPTDAEKWQARRAEILTRSIGVIYGATDIEKARRTLIGEAVVAEYSFDDKHLRVRGTDLTDQMKVAIVHELTEALQDQRLDAASTLHHVAGNQGSDVAAFRALIEGDAQRIVETYEQSLPASTRAEIASADADLAKTIAANTGSVPPFMKTEFGSTQELGLEVAHRARDLHDDNAIDSLLRTPPEVMLQVMEPWLAGAQWTSTTAASPHLQDGDKVRNTGSLGALDLYLVLAERLPIGDALAAAGAWGGDVAVDFERAGRSCTAVSLQGPTANQTVTLRSALQRWAAMSSGAASVADAGESVVLTACDPGPGAEIYADKSQDALYVLATRNAIASGLEGQHASAEVARCYADDVVTYVNVDDLRRLNGGPPSPQVIDEMRRAGARCIAGAASNRNG